eukprot:8629894-Alexandrium_andersonii.AAC.1
MGHLPRNLTPPPDHRKQTTKTPRASYFTTSGSFRRSFGEVESTEIRKVSVTVSGGPLAFSGAVQQFQA